MWGYCFIHAVGRPRPENRIKQDTFLTPFFMSILELSSLWGIESKLISNMEFNEFLRNTKQFDEIAPNVFRWRKSGLNLSTRIYKYIDLSALIDIGKGNFRVQQRRNFSDRYESNISLRREYYSENDEENCKKADERALNEYMKKLSAELPTSCFTKRSGELHAMWKAFTSGYTGVRIASTIGQVVESMRSSDYNLYIGTMKYEKVVWRYDALRDMFSKDLCYSPEKELRIYFVPKNGSLEKETFDSNGVINLNVDSGKFITEITLSPFIPRAMYMPIHDMISAYFSKARIKSSTINEKPIK